MHPAKVVIHIVQRDRVNVVLKHTNMWNTINNVLVMRELVLVLALFVSSCSQASVVSKHPPNEHETASTPIASPPTSSEGDIRKLEERLPAPTRQILEDAEFIELFDTVKLSDTKFCMKLLFPEIMPIERNKFLGCGYSKRVVIKDAALKRQFLDVLFLGASTPSSGAACFDPKYGVRAASKKDRVDLIICFDCENFRGASTAGSVGGGISKASLALFEQIFANSAQK